MYPYVYIQVYPTMLRSFGMSLCSSASRVGAMISPFIPQVSEWLVISFINVPKFNRGNFNK